MREYIDRNWEKNAARLTQQAKIVILVEGSSDKKLYKRLLTFWEKYYVQTIQEVSQNQPQKSRGNKQSVIQFLEDLETEEQRLQVIAIVDADFDHLDPKNAAQHPNLFRTDTHDLETLILKSPVLEKILDEFASEEKLRAYPLDFRQILLNLGQPLGYLLWISLQENLGLTFEDLSFKRFIDEASLKPNLEGMLKTIQNKSSPEAKAKTKNLDDLKARILALQQQEHDPWQVCCGHHLVAILALALRKAIGSNDAKDVDPETVLDRSLRLAYEQVYFQQTHLYAALQAWHDRVQA